MRIERFEDIEAWQLARELTGKVKARNIILNPAFSGKSVNAYNPKSYVVEVIEYV